MMVTTTELVNKKGIIKYKDPLLGEVSGELEDFYLQENGRTTVIIKTDEGLLFADSENCNFIS